jgi:hypothetical protein
MNAAIARTPNKRPPIPKIAGGTSVAKNEQKKTVRSGDNHRCEQCRMRSVYSGANWTVQSFAVAIQSSEETAPDHQVVEIAHSDSDIELVFL